MPLVLLQALALPRPLAPMADWCSFDDSDAYNRRTAREWHLMCELCVLEKMLLASGMTPEELIENRAPWRRWDPLPPGNCEAWDRAFPPGSPAPPSDSDSEPASQPASPRLEPFVPGGLEQGTSASATDAEGLEGLELERASSASVAEG